jgi:hypothetical protein
VVLHEVVKEILVAVLVAGLCEVLLGHHVIVGVISLPCELLALLRYPCFFLALSIVLAKEYEKASRS